MRLAGTPPEVGRNSSRDRQGIRMTLAEIQRNIVTKKKKTDKHRLQTVKKKKLQCNEKKKYNVTDHRQFIMDYYIYNLLTRLM